MFQAPESTYQHTVIGTWGEFQTPAGCVAYLMTKARLGRTGTDNERRLTSQLRPVREVLDPKTLDFNQLLQRDLDDHRVATELLPYLLKQKSNGPAFFPPIMAVLLPFRGPEPVDEFPEKTDVGEIEYDRVKYLETRYSDAFRIHRLSLDGQIHPTIKLGRVEWNEEHAKLVVLDGQHRAMALLAVDRTINHTWQNSGGERYRHFYEHRVHALLKEAESNELSIDLSNIEVPVTLCWFPRPNEQGGNAHKAARKLFVDVNKEARQPSEARLTLLSDNELLNIFTRRLLNRLREEQPPMPLYVIEYDNPHQESARPVRWSVLANLSLLKLAVQYTVFGPDKYITNVRSRMGGGRPNWRKMNERMHQQLRLKDLLPMMIDDGDWEFDRKNIENENFPLSKAHVLTDEFMNSWGEAILSLLGQVLPYNAHCVAAQSLRDEWVTDDAMSSLASDALFVGVGMFWTLRSSNNHWKELVRQRREEQRPVPPKPEIVRAWDILDPRDGRKTQDFKEHRAFAYTGKKDAGSISDTEALYDVVNTHACQLGLILGFATLCYRLGYQGSQITKFARDCAIAWNSGLISQVNKSRDRRFILGRGNISTNKYPLNRTRKMDTPLAVFFRYFWLEILYIPEAFEHIGKHFAEGDMGSAELRQLVWESRDAYVGYLIDEQMKDLRWVRLYSNSPSARNLDHLTSSSFGRPRGSGLGGEWSA